MQNSQDQGISHKTKNLIDNLLLGRFSLPEVAKITGISEQCLQIYVNAKQGFFPRSVLS